MMSRQTITLVFADESSCPEWERLYGLFVNALSEVIRAEIDKSLADDRERIGLDWVLREALGREQQAKNALMLHLRTHPQCGSSGAPD